MSNKPLNQYVLITPDNGVTKITGEYPHDLVAKLCSMYKSIIVIDQHTNTIKFVEKVMDNPEALDVRTVKEVSLDPANDATDKVDKQQLNYIASLLSKFRPGKDYGWGIYRITGSRTFNTEELGKIAYATVVASDFGKKAQFILKDGTISFNDIFNTIDVEVGDTIDPYKVIVVSMESNTPSLNPNGDFENSKSVRLYINI